MNRLKKHKTAAHVRSVLMEGVVQGRMENIRRWIRVLDLHEFDDPLILEHCVRLGHLKTPLDFYTVQWGPRLQAGVDRTRMISLAKFLRAMGAEQLGDAQVAKLKKHIGGLTELLAWASKGGYFTVHAHDIGQTTLAHVRTLLQQNVDLVEALDDVLDIV